MDVARFFIFFLGLTLVSLAGAGIAFAVSAQVHTTAIANLLIALIYVISMVSSTHNVHCQLDLCGDD